MKPRTKDILWTVSGVLAVVAAFALLYYNYMCKAYGPAHWGGSEPAATTKPVKVVAHGPDELTQEFKFEGHTYIAVRIGLRPSAEAGKIDHNGLQLRAQACLDLCLWDFQQAVVKGDAYVALFRLISNDEQKWADKVMAGMIAPSNITIENPLTTQPGK